MRLMYKKERLDKKNKKLKKDRRDLLMRRYKKERREEQMAIMTGKTVYGEENGQRLLAFSKSIYSDGKLQDQARSWVHNRREEKFGKICPLGGGPSCGGGPASLVCDVSREVCECPVGRPGVCMDAVSGPGDLRSRS